MPSEPIKKKLFLGGEESLNGLNAKAEKLLELQLADWPLASKGYNSLSAVQVKAFEFDNYSIEAHFNPGRYVSSSAKVDAKSIEARPCFLCIDNLPEEQKAVKAINDYIILVNPFPIFTKHFTIPSINHIPQAIENEIGNMLTISEMLGKDYTVFYNGPRCGASAPDHMHFQAGNFGFMKIDNEHKSILNAYGQIVFEDSEIVISAVTGCLRNFISLESNNAEKLKNKFKQIYNILSGGIDNAEPMMNIICSYYGAWRLLIFPRKKHRPTYFFSEGEDKMLISPASVDLGGVCIFPREEDFNKITKELIIDIFNQVTIDNQEFSDLTAKLANG